MTEFEAYLMWISDNWNLFEEETQEAIQPNKPLKL